MPLSGPALVGEDVSAIDFVSGVLFVQRFLRHGHCSQPQMRSIDRWHRWPLYHVGPIKLSVPWRIS